MNDLVKVQLTPRGHEIYQAQHTEILKLYPFFGVYQPPLEDEHGWSVWQLWRLMQLFGPHIHLGGSNCFETTIELCEVQP